jgi:dihydroorotate dehydrogenase
MGEYGMGRACGEDTEMVRHIARWVSEVATKPVFIKITPNWAYADELSIAAMEGGAAGVTLTNTMPSLMDPNPEGNPWPRVGVKE